MKKRRWFLTILALWLASACAQPEGKLTEVIVAVDADPKVAKNLSRVDIEIFDPEAADGDGTAEPASSRSFVVNAAKAAAGTATFPFSVGVRKIKSRRFLLVVTGYAGNKPVIEQKAFTSFVDEEVRGLGIYLASPCFEQLCDGVEASTWLRRTCSAESGECDEVATRDTTRVRPLNELDAGLFVIDPATGADGELDAGEDDASTEGGPTDTPPDSHADGDTLDAAGATASEAGAASVEAGAPSACGPELCNAPGRSCQAGICVCNPGFSGTNCQTDACEPNPCQHGGGCNRTAQGASCDCGTGGYNGARCETDINECASANACTSPDYPCVQTAPPGYTCRGQFADWHMPDALPGSKFAPSYDTATTPGVVFDQVTGLSWQRTVAPGTYTQPAAKSYCESLSLASQSDWRLPTTIELESIIDETKYDPAIDSGVFPSTPADSFWTAIRVGNGSFSYAWVVQFGVGRAFNNAHPEDAHRVRCVRSNATPIAAGTPADRFAVTASGDIVTDTRTGLTWERTVSAATSWDLAKAHCPGRGNGWRLPSLKELLTVIEHYNRTDSPFEAPSLGAIWTASPVAGSSGLTWWVVAPFGPSFDGYDASQAASVACVR